MSEYQDGWGYPTDSWSLRGTTNDGLQLCSRRPIPSPRGEPIRILVYKSLPYSLLGTTSPAPTLWTGEFRPRVRTPNKALYCLILWLIGICSLAEPKKTFHQTMLKCFWRISSLDLLMVPLSLDLLVTWDFPGFSMLPSLPRGCLGKARTSPLGLFGFYFLDSQSWALFLLPLLFFPAAPSERAWLCLATCCSF